MVVVSGRLSLDVVMEADRQQSRMLLPVLKRCWWGCAQPFLTLARVLVAAWKAHDCHRIVRTWSRVGTRRSGPDSSRRLHRVEKKRKVSVKLLERKAHAR